MNKDIPETVCGRRMLYTSRVPVHPCVREALGLETYRGKTVLFTFKGNVELSFEGYVERYMEYCLSMKRYVGLEYFPF